MLHYLAMGTHAVQKVVAVRDAIDRLEWRVRIGTDFFGTNLARVFLSGWEGRVRFYRESAPSAKSITLRAHWLNPERGRFIAPQEQVFDFATELPHAALDRLDEFRSAGRLFARLEGKMLLIQKTESPDDRGRDWTQEVARFLGDPQRVMSTDIISEFFEMSRDAWCDEILGVLRPPGRHVIEVQAPSPSLANEGAVKVVSHLKEAQFAFDQGRWQETARVCYRALDELKGHAAAIEERYGQHAKGRVIDEIKAVCSICNPVRHAEAAEHDGLEFDRALAQHVLIAASSLTGLVFR